MRPSNIATFLFLLSGSVFPAAVSAQPDTAPNVHQPQTQSTPVQPERTPQQSDEARKQENRSAEDIRVNRDWTTPRREDNMRQRQIDRDQMDQDEDRRTVGRSWRRDDGDMDRGPRYGDRREGRYYNETRPRRRVKTCIEYENGEEFCRYRD
jgi:hypothetical protein